MASFLDTMSDVWNTARDRYLGWQSSWGGVGNTNNALISGALSAIGVLSDTFTARRALNLYEQQEKAYIQNAEEQAKRMRLKGEIALRNLYVEHTKMQGTNELAVAAAGAGGYSGSFLDKLVENKKYNEMDERTQKLQTLFDIDNIRRQGYVQAISTAGSAAAYANKMRSNSWNALSSMLRTISGGINADIRVQQQIGAQQQIRLIERDAALDKIDYLYGMQNSGLRDYGLGSGITPDSLLKINDTLNPTNIDAPASDSLLNTGEVYYG